MKSQTIHAIIDNKIIAILRKVKPEYIVPTAEALYNGGIMLIEVTFDQSDSKGSQETVKAIKALTESFADRILVGAGTVMTKAQAQAAFEAGARYLISPHTDIDIIKMTNRLGVVSIPGAITPSEIVLANNSGADFVKLFPAGNFGLEYIKAIMAPISHIPMLAVGGVNESNVGMFLSAGIKGVAIGSNLVNNELINEGRFNEITMMAKRYTEKVKG